MRSKTLFSTLLLFLMAFLFMPELHVQPDGDFDISVATAAFADSGGEDPNPNPKPAESKKSESKGKKEDEEGEGGGAKAGAGDPPGKKDDKGEEEPAKKAKNDDSKGFDPDNYVSKEDYNSLEKRLDQLSKDRRQEVIQRRVDHAVSEQLVDENDEEALNHVRNIAQDDDAWEAYKKVSKPKTPDHITARTFQRKNLKSIKHTGRQATLDKVLEHQKS